jgi:replicative DNA helicase
MTAGFQSSGNGSSQGAGRRTAAGAASAGDRLPPHNLEAERSVLGSVLLDNDVLHEVVPFLKPPHFYRDAHQVIYAAICDLYDKSKGIDAVTLAEELKRRDQFDQVGGDDILTEICESVPHAANGKYYAEIVREKATSRTLIESATEIIRDGYSNQFTADELLESAERKIFTIAQDQVSAEGLGIKDVLEQAMERIGGRATNRHPITGLASGLVDLDDITAGFQAGQLIVLAARPSMGKTALALNICDHVAVALGKPALFVSLEMGNIEIAERLLCARSGVDGHKLRSGVGMTNEDLILLGRAFTQLTAAGQIYIDDTPARNMLQITATARRLKLHKDISIVLVDYIQLVGSEDSRDSRQEQIAKISRRLKTLARELKVPVIALSQLNRAVEHREDRRPRMADLRESGAIEQDADMVLLLHRPEYYDPDDQPGIAELIVAKNRNGPVGNVNLTFLKKLTRFENLAAVAEPFDEGRPF